MNSCEKALFQNQRNVLFQFAKSFLKMVHYIVFAVRFLLYVDAGLFPFFILFQGSCNQNCPYKMFMPHVIQAPRRIMQFLFGRKTYIYMMANGRCQVISGYASIRA